MSKPILCILAFLFAAFTACKDDAVNFSKVHLESPDDFVLHSIERGANNQWVCIGYKVNTYKAHVLEYDQNLVLQRSTYLPDINLFKGDNKIISLQDKGWVIGNITQGPEITMDIYVTDVDFKVRAEYHRTVSSFHDDYIYEIMHMKNGDIAVVSDVADSTNGVRIQRFTAKLEPIFEYFPIVGLYNDNQINYGYGGRKLYSPRLIELPNEDLFYATALDGSFFRDLGGGVFSFGEVDSLVTGLLSKTGEVKFTGNSKLNVTHAENIGISYTGTNIIYNSIVNDEHIQSYATLNLQTGKIMEEKALGSNFTNHQFASRYLLGHFTRGEANAMPKILTGGQGHLVYSETDKKLYFLEVDAQLNFTERFSLTLPRFTSIVSYRQLFTERNTIVAGVSYTYNGKSFFSLQEVDFKGKVIN